MKPQQAPKPIATLPIPRGVSNLITLAHTIVNKMTGNPYFPSPSPSMATVLADIVALEGAEAYAQTKAKGAVEARDVKLRALRDRLHYVKANVQATADADPANAEAIITSVSYSVRKAKARTKQDLVVKMGTASGLVKLMAKSAGARAAYDWQWSLDQKVLGWCRSPFRTTSAAVRVRASKAGSEQG
jgi:hypothetical protein